MASSEWYQLIYKCFPKRDWKYAKEICMDFGIILSNMKPSFVWDVCSTERNILENFISELQNAHLVNEHIKIYTVNGDFLVVNRMTLLNMIDNILSGEEKRIFVSIDEKSPCILPHIEHLNRVLEAIKTSLLNSTTIYNVFELEEGINFSFPTLYGIFFGYPVIYWNKTRLHCLNHTYLRVYDVQGTFDVKRPFSYTIYKFSIPVDLITAEVNKFVSKWFINSVFNKKLPHSSYFDVHMRFDTVRESYLILLGYIKQAKDYYFHIFNLKNTLDSLRNLENVYNYLVERWHYRMLNDYTRNNSFKLAITKKIKSGFNKVLDIGTGTGLLSLYAKDAGAKEIYACDCSETMIDISKQVFNSNNVKNDIKLLPMLSTDLQIQRDLPQRVNLVVTETMDCGLLGEHVLQTLNHAWEHLLLPPCPSNVQEKQNYGSVIPLGASIYIAALQSDYIRLGNTVLTPYLNFLGINNKVRAHREEPYDTINYKMLPGNSEILSEELDVFNVNFNDPNDIKSILNGEKRTSVKITLNKTGRIDAIIAWFKLHLDEDISLSSGPDTNSCWEQAVFPLPYSLDVKENDDIKLEISCKNGKLTVNVQEDNKDEFLLLSEAAIRFLNDAHCINSLLSAVIQNSHENVLDMNPFPIIGLYLLKKGLTKLVCSIGITNNADKMFLEKESSLLMLNSIEDIIELGYYVEFDLIILHPISTSGEINNENLLTLEFIKYVLQPR